MRQLSVEYAHIYANRPLFDEHQTSLAALAGVTADYTGSPELVSLVVMVDDYSYPDPNFDYESFLDWLDGEGYKPDLMIRESQLIPLCDEVIRAINDQPLKAHLIKYIQTKKYPCSLFIAAWYLLRLGVLRSPLMPEDLIADHLVNILPESFEPFEIKAQQIIKTTEYAGLLDKIGYRYLPGRPIA